MTPVTELLKQCDWLSIKQLLIYHSLLLLHKTLVNKKPAYILEKLNFSQRETRTSIGIVLRDERNFKIVTASKGFIPRTTRVWNSLQYDMRTIKEPNAFKTRLLAYVKNYV